MTNAVFHGEAQVWLRLVRGDGSMDDLDVVALFTDGLPDWLTIDLLREGALTHALGAPNYGIGDGWALWAMHHGVAPGQPFLVRLVEPRGWRDYWGEWDVEYDGELLDVEAWPRERLARQWERYLAWHRGRIERRRGNGVDHG